MRELKLKPRKRNTLEGLAKLKMQGRMRPRVFERYYPARTEKPKFAMGKEEREALLRVAEGFAMRGRHLPAFLIYENLGEEERAKGHFVLDCTLCKMAHPLRDIVREVVFTEMDLRTVVHDLVFGKQFDEALHEYMEAQLPKVGDPVAFFFARQKFRFWAEERTDDYVAKMEFVAESGTDHKYIHAFDKTGMDYFVMMPCGYTEYHRDILAKIHAEGVRCIGGGWGEYNGKEIELYGKSGDFGIANHVKIARIFNAMLHNPETRVTFTLEELAQALAQAEATELPEGQP